MAKDCNVGESCSGSVPLRPAGCRRTHGSSPLLSRVGREAVEVRMRDAAGRSRANTEKGGGQKEEKRSTREDRRKAPSAVTLITTPLG